MAEMKRVNELVAQALALEEEDARAAGRLGFMARAMALASMPHSNPKSNEFVRRNGNFTLTMIAPSAIGLPYGALPRLLMAWVTTEAARTKQRELELGDTLSDFMRQLDIAPTGGRWGSIPRLRSQMNRLFNATVNCTAQDEGMMAAMGYRVADKLVTWWDPKQPTQKALWGSTVTLSERFFEEIAHSPVPVDMGALKALRRSPMALDLYVWLTHRMSYLEKPTTVPWESLRAQFGADYRLTRQFRAALLKHLKAVAIVYPEAGIDVSDGGIELKPGKPHVRRLAK